MRPKKLKTRIFLDSGNPAETADALSLLGFLDGQTTNPSLVAKNPDVVNRLAEGKKFAKEEIEELYRDVVRKISKLMPSGSVSVEVYADRSTSSEQMYSEGMRMSSWIPNAHIKLPITDNGLEGARRLLSEGVRVNMTLCFSQQQAAAVYAALPTAKKGSVFLSPFIGRLDDIGFDGMDLVRNIMNMYGQVDGRIEVIAASVRNKRHFDASLACGCDIITAPLGILRSWAADGCIMPKEIPAPETPLKGILNEYGLLAMEPGKLDIRHELTDKGIAKFCADWDALIATDR